MARGISSSKALVPVRAVDFVMYNTRDIRRTREFYRRMFGFKRGEEWNDWWTEFATGSVPLCLNGDGNSGSRGWDWSGPACIALAAESVPEAIEKCRRHRAKILIDPVGTRVCWMAWIADPDGNRICLHSRKDVSAG